MLEIRRLTKNFGGIIATNDLSIAVSAGEFHGIIGPNGAGKTTLVAQISGEIWPTSGAIIFDGEDITSLTPYQRCQKGIARSYQITSVFPDFSCLQNMFIAIQAHRGHSFRFWSDASINPAWRDEACRTLDAVGLGHRIEEIAGKMAYGEQRQLELAMALAGTPKLLILDEPMAGIAGEEAGRIVRLLEGLKRRYTIVLVEHDMDVVFGLADRISVLVYGSCLMTGSPDEVRNDQEVQEVYLGDDKAL